MRPLRAEFHEYAFPERDPENEDRTIQRMRILLPLVRGTKIREFHLARINDEKSTRPSSEKEEEVKEQTKPTRDRGALPVDVSSWGI